MKIPMGLTQNEVKKRQEKYGFNEINEKFDSAFVRLIKKFIGPIPLMIELALVLSLFAHKYEDFFIIAVLLVVNIGVDFFQEQKAHKALDALKNTLAPRAFVIRDGEKKYIPARELVPGDIIRLMLGDIVPADTKIVTEIAPLSVNQSQITGESLPVTMHKGDEPLAGSIIERGEAWCEVIATGKNSSVGKNAGLIAEAERNEESHFQKAIFRISRFLMFFALFFIVIVVIVLLLRGDSLGETIRFALVLAVASIPVALPAVLSVTLAIGASKLAEEKVIVSHFKAMEELAGIDILCTDKTGTVTQNILTIEKPLVYNDYSEKELFHYALLTSKTEQETAIGKAIYNYAKKHFDTNISEFQIQSYEPFDPITKIVQVHVKKGNEKFDLIIGATQKIANQLEHIPNDFNTQINQFAEKGFKSLALAIRKQGKEKFILMGLIPLFDPPREDSKKVISYLRKKGIQLKMITGDHTAIARYIGKLLGLGDKVVRNEDLQNIIETENTKDDIKMISQTDIFTEVAPEHKYHIVDILQKNGHIVAMTGDGVNDAPALKKADIGIAVAGATAAARSAADLVLLTNGLSVIKTALDSARMIFSRMKSYATFRIAETIRVVLFITLSLIFFNSEPLSAIMIILLALLNDIPVMAIAYDNAPVIDTPMRWQLRETLIVSLVLGISGVLSSFLLFAYLKEVGISLLIIQSIIFLKLDVAGHSTLYTTRTGRKHFWQRPFPSLKFFLPAFGSRIIGTILVLFGIFMAQLSITTIIFIWIYATFWFILNDFIKVKTYKIIDSYHRK